MDERRHDARRSLVHLLGDCVRVVLRSVRGTAQQARSTLSKHVCLVTCGVADAPAFLLAAAAACERC